MSRPRYRLVLVAAVLAVAVGPVAAVTEGSPDLSVHLPDNRVVAGEDVTLELYLLNRGDVTSAGPQDEEAQTTTARNTTVTLEAGGAPIAVRTGTRPIGNVPEGRVGPIPFAVDVDSSADPGRYGVPVRIDYRYTSEIDTQDPDDPTRETATESLERRVTVVVEARARFAAVSAQTDTSSGASGDVTVALENVGSAPASQSQVILESDDPALSFGDHQAARAYVGDWAPGEVRTVTVDARFADGTGTRSVPIVATVEFEDDRGRAHASDGLAIGATPRNEQSFAVDGVASTLAVGRSGTLRGTLRNTGPGPVRNAVVVLSTENANLVPGETEYAIGDLETGAATAFAFEVDVTETAEPGPRLLSLAVRYRDASGAVRRSDPHDVRVDVGPRRPVFNVEPVRARFEIGGSGVLELRVANADDEPVSDVTAKLFPNDPLASSDDEAFVGRLDPGASTTVRFALSVGSDALEKPYPVSLDFQYDDADGDTRLSDTYRLPVDVAAPTNARGPATTVVAVSAIGLLVLVSGLWFWRRR